MIKRYKEFLVEKLDDQDIFLVRFENLIDELRSNPSFTTIARFSRINPSEELSAAMDDLGLTWTELKANKLLIFEHINRYDSINGVVDWLLYNLNQEYVLGGFENDLETNLDELSVKYEYGYHLNVYGEKYLLQCFDSMQEYYNTIITNIFYLMFFSEYNGVRKYFDFKGSDFNSKSKIDFSSAIIRQEESVWYLDFSQLYDLLMGHYKESINILRGSDHVEKVFNLIISLLEDFFNRDIQAGIIVVEEENDYIKISASL